MSRGFPFIALAGMAVLACRTTPGPEATAQAYAQALRENRLDDAYALTASAKASEGLSRDAFAQRYANAEARAARATAVEQALPSATVRAGALTMVRRPEGWRVLEPSDDAGARKALEAFLNAAEAGDFKRAYALLAAPLRARYTPERLEKDFKAEPLAKERLSRARAALSSSPLMEGDRVLFPIGQGKAVQLAPEEGGYRVLALE